MGQIQSKRASSTTTTTSSTRFLTRHRSRAASSADFSAPIVDITPPRPPHHLHRISELIDPLTLILPDPSTPPQRSRSNTLESQLGTDEARNSTGRFVQSPSGNLLGAEEFLNHPNRPLAMWERRERVINATREGFERLETESRAEATAEQRQSRDRGGKRGRRCCCQMW